MSRKSKFRMLATGAALVVAITGIVFATQFASALTGPPGGEWATVQQYIDDYIQGQYIADDGAQGEAGFQMNQAALKSRLDSNNDGVYLGEGDDTVNAPVLIDNLRQLTTMIPGTSFRCRWTEPAADGDCFTASSVDTVKTLVDNHEAAGFSTDIVDYCQTNHTASPTTGAFGYIAQTGALGGTTTPEVYGFKWGRNGWTNTIGGIYTRTGALAAPDPAGTFDLASNALDCSAETTDAGLVRCAAQWAISAAGGNVGNGQVPGGTIDAPTLTAGQIVDIRSGTVGSSIDSAGGPTVSIPIETLFNTGLTGVDPAASGGMLVASRTQGMGGIAALGLRMLGYTTAPGGFVNSGIPGWNGTLDEKQVDSGVSYPLDTVTALTDPNSATVTDNTAPVITVGPSAVPATDSATISRTADVPATMKVEYGTTQGGPYTSTVNNTVLNAVKSVELTGLTADTTYYYRVTSYDAQANATVSDEASFTTSGPIGPEDKVYYLPWYDSRPAAGWIGDWIGVVNMDTEDANVEIRIGGVTMDTQVIPAGQDWDPSPQNYPNEFDGPVEVICWDCATKSTILVVNQRALYGPTFSEILAVESADLGTQYVFPWYDNLSANNVMGAWIMVTNTDTTEATVEITIGGTLEDTLTIPAGEARFYIDPTHALIGGPVLVESTGGETILVSQRVLYGNSFNEILGQKIL